MKKALLYGLLLSLLLFCSNTAKADDAAKGEAIYKSKCQSCHGVNGNAGYSGGTKNAANFAYLNANPERIRELLLSASKEDLIKIVREGGSKSGVRWAGAAMPKIGLQPGEIYDVVAYIRQLGTFKGDMYCSAIIDKIEDNYTHVGGNGSIEINYLPLCGVIRNVSITTNEASWLKNINMTYPNEDKAVITYFVPKNTTSNLRKNTIKITYPFFAGAKNGTANHNEEMKTLNITITQSGINNNADKNKVVKPNEIKDKSNKLNGSGLEKYDPNIIN